MPPNNDVQQFRNEDLVLNVSTSVDRAKWDESRYESFLDELCGSREYQKDAIRAVLRFWLSGNYQDLRELARKNFEVNSHLEQRYGSWQNMERQLQLPDHLAATVDIATGAGKSYVLYGLAMIMLAEGKADQVLVLCPSTTIEAGLLEKFRELASNTGLQAALPQDARLLTPSIINATKTIVEGSICVENYHAILEHVGSSIYDSLQGKGSRTVVLNDEAHHVANESSAKIKRWKAFLVDPAYGFNYIAGVSGTCYIDDEYFSDVIYRYSLRQAMEQRYVKFVEYVAEMPQTGEPEEKWQLIRNRHEHIKSRLQHRRLLPLTIVVTPSVRDCNDIADELKGFLQDTERISEKQADERVLVVYNGSLDVNRLRYVDLPGSMVEWIVSVSMLNEGWDVKRVFQIVPHEKRAFASKLLIAQVLGRGLRIPESWSGEQPVVTVFNHDAWAGSIRHLVNEVLEFEKRISVHVIPDSPYHFDLHNIEYLLEPHSVKKPMTGGYTLFEKGYIELPADVADQDVSIDFERASTGIRQRWQTRIQRKTYTSREVAEHMYERMEREQDPDDPDIEARTYYTDRYPVEKLEQIVTTSLARVGLTVATDNLRQKFLQALGPLRRKVSENVRYEPVAKPVEVISTRSRQSDSVSASELRRDKVLFSTPHTRSTLKDEQVEFFDEVAEPGGQYRHISTANPTDFKTPLNAAIADSDPERRFIRMLLEPANMPHYVRWIKSTAVRFYEIDYSWKKANTPKRGKFSPDFFIQTDKFILVVEVKGDNELDDPAEENRKKYEYAVKHFARINEYLEQQGLPIRYRFNFLTPRNFGTYFQYLRDGHIGDYRSELDVKLIESD